MDIWVTSDTHYGHLNITGPTVSRWSSGYRNFTSTKEMNNTLIENINKCVKENDILYFLGDWTFGGIHNIYYFRKALNCKTIHFILGNHDKHIKNKEVKFNDSTFNPYDLFESVHRDNIVEIGSNRFYMSHYYTKEWIGHDENVIHLFGHSHGNLETTDRSMDVGIDCHPEFRPFHIDEVLKIIENKEIL